MQLIFRFDRKIRWSYTLVDVLPPSINHPISTRLIFHFWSINQRSSRVARACASTRSTFHRYPSIDGSTFSKHLHQPCNQTNIVLPIDQLFYFNPWIEKYSRKRTFSDNNNGEIMDSARHSRTQRETHIHTSGRHGERRRTRIIKAFGGGFIACPVDINWAKCQGRLSLLRRGCFTLSAGEHWRETVRKRETDRQIESR